MSGTPIEDLKEYQPVLEEDVTEPPVETVKEIKLYISLIEINKSIIGLGFNMIGQDGLTNLMKIEAIKSMPSAQDLKDLADRVYTEVYEVDLKNRGEAETTPLEIVTYECHEVLISFATIPLFEAVRDMFVSKGIKVHTPIYTAETVEITTGDGSPMNVTNNKLLGTWVYE